MSDAVPSSVPAVVTGASSGIGEEFCHQLAGRGHDLLIVARRVTRLRSLARELQREHGVAVEALAADLETAAGRRLVAVRLRGGGPRLLVNNAGFGSSGSFAELDQERELAEVMVNVVAVEELTGAVIPECVAAGAGGVLNVASTAAFQPLPHMATYAATKAFVLHLSEALAVELSGTGVRCMALCPGPTRTEFGEVAGNATELDNALPMSVAEVVTQALGDFDAGHAISIPGRRNALVAHSVRLLPRAAVRRVAGRIFAPR
ncbi:MAG: SDR family NAD(P)-dependent oxidoreductase [Candidatus Dormibacteria bacterium]